MNAQQYAKSKYSGFPTYEKIAEDAFKAGLDSAKLKDVKALENELKQAKKELKDLWKTINDPEEFAELIAGL